MGRSWRWAVTQIVWLVIVAVHVVAGAFFALSAWFYVQLDGSLLDVALAIYFQGWDATHHRIVAVECSLIATGHLIGLLSMVQIPPVQCLPFACRWPWVQVNRPLSRRNSKSDPPRRESFIKRFVVKAYAFFFSSSGFFGLNGGHYDALLTVRELLETSMLSYQAYRLSIHISRVQLNRFYVGVLVVNCWLHPLMHTFFDKQVFWRRLLLLLGDIILDLLNTVGVPLFLVLSYYPLYDARTRTISNDLWYVDTWFASAINEFQLILLATLSDLLIMAILSLSLLRSLSTAKKLLVMASKPETLRPLTSVAVQPGGHIPSVSKGKETPTPHSRCGVAFISRTVFALWGCLILGFHLHAASLPALRSCPLQLRPWWGTKPACALLVINCQQLRIGGRDHDIATTVGIANIDPRFVQQITIRHCSNLDVPPSIAQLHAIIGLKIYNSTVASWGEDAAITNARHPALQSVYLVRTYFDQAELPAGLVARDFPQKLYDVEVYISNLASLPPDLDESWFPGSTLAFELCNFTSIPDVIYRLRPAQLSFYGNQLTDFPTRAMALPDLFFLQVGRNPYNELPASNTVVDAGAPLLLYVGETNISMLPAWVDDVISRGYAFYGFSSLYATGTPLCDALLKIQEESMVSLPTDSVNDQSAMLTSGSVRIDRLLTQIQCFPELTTYPIFVEE